MENLKSPHWYRLRLSSPWHKFMCKNLEKKTSIKDSVVCCMCKYGNILCSAYVKEASSLFFFWTDSRKEMQHLEVPEQKGFPIFD